MKVSLIEIGNSKGIRIPKPIIDHCQLTGEIEMEISKNRLILHSPIQARKGWDESFKKMAASGDDEIILPDQTSAWDEQDWEWK